MKNAKIDHTRENEPVPPLSPSTCLLLFSAMVVVCVCRETGTGTKGMHEESQAAGSHVCIRHVKGKSDREKYRRERCYRGEEREREGERAERSH